MKTLDLETKHKTEYCVPLWLRDAQIKQSIARVAGRLQPGEQTTEPVAVVCYGPSLAETWEKVREFKHVISCSGSHRFLIDRGIIPNWHVEVDPRSHKVALLGEPDPGVHYLPSSTCHPDYFTHLLNAGAKVSLWHVFASDEEATRVLPRGEWALTGGSNVGLRAIAIARFLGFTNQHIFGMDGCVGPAGMHAGAHPNQPPPAQTEYKGKTYLLTTGMLESAKQTFHELDMLNDVEATFYGEGLVQEMAKDYKPKPRKGAILAYNRPELISAEYRALNERLHKENLFYGVGGSRWAAIVLKLAESLKTHSVLDYGAGKGHLAREIPWPIWEYDPAIPGKETPPRAADLVVCTDVLEHIEPEKILLVLEDLQRVTRQVGFFVIHTGPSTKLLADGRNAHILQRDAAWWGKMLAKFFFVGKIVEKGPLLLVTVGRGKTAGMAKRSAIPA